MAREIVDADFVLEHLEDLPIVDVRPHYLYEDSHIPGAYHVDLMATMEEADDPDDVAVRLAQKLSGDGVGPDDPVILYCMRGLVATEAADLLETQGYNQIKLYRGSFVDWIDDDDRPVEGS